MVITCPLCDNFLKLQYLNVSAWIDNNKIIHNEQISIYKCTQNESNFKGLMISHYNIGFDKINEVKFKSIFINNLGIFDDLSICGVYDENDNLLIKLPSQDSSKIISKLENLLPFL